MQSTSRQAPGVLAVGEIKHSSSDDLIESLNKSKSSLIPTILMLDDLVDPGNVGTLIRTAEWFGLSGVICSPNTVDVWNSKVIQSSMGSIFKIPLCIADPVEVLKEFELKAVSLDTHGEDLYQSDFSPEALVIGSESHGVSEKLEKACHKSWTIPGIGMTESLNAAIAGAIVTSELARRCNVKKL